MARNETNKVRQLQSLYCKAKQEKEASYSLYDKLYREDVLWEAWRQVKPTRGAGVDGKSIETLCQLNERQR